MPDSWKESALSELLSEDLGELTVIGVDFQSSPLEPKIQSYRGSENIFRNGSDVFNLLQLSAKPGISI